MHTADNTETLPGEVARTDGDPPTGDPAVDEAFDSSGQVLELFATQFARRSMDGQGSPVSITVHFGVDYANAFWDGTQLVFGDGDGVIFDRFTEPMDVMAHEFAHGVTQFTAGLAYVDQSGALNESISDVFAAMTKQLARSQTADQADWLIGEGLFRPGVDGRALRSMLEPGTAYDDPRIGRDPQVGRMADYVTTTDDNGGVHINSGIPNRAFALAARDLGGFTWERIGKVWYDALTAGEVTAGADFAALRPGHAALGGADLPRRRRASRAGSRRAGGPSASSVTRRRSIVPRTPTRCRTSRSRPRWRSAAAAASPAWPGAPSSTWTPTPRAPRCGRCCPSYRCSRSRSVRRHPTGSPTPSGTASGS